MFSVQCDDLQCLFQQLQNSSILSHNKPLSCFGIFRPSPGRCSTNERITQRKLIMTWMCNCRVKKDVTAYKNQLMLCFYFCLSNTSVKMAKKDRNI